MSDDALTSDARTRRRWPFGWLGLLALAWVIFELTHQPALAAAVVAAKFGTEDFLTAAWLYRRDPARPRARATFCLYTAWGLWKVAAVAFLMSVAFALVAPRQVFRGQPVPAVLQGLVGTLLTTLTGLALSALFTALALLFARAGGARLWLDRGAHRARRLDAWPPSPYCEGRTNRLGDLVVTAVGAALIAVFAHFLTRAAAPHWSAPLLLAASPLVVLGARELVLRWYGARSARECWPSDEEA